MGEGQLQGRVVRFSAAAGRCIDAVITTGANQACPQFGTIGAVLEQEPVPAAVVGLAVRAFVRCAAHKHRAIVGCCDGIDSPTSVNQARPQLGPICAVLGYESVVTTGLVKVVGVFVSIGVTAHYDRAITHYCDGVNRVALIAAH